MEYLNLLNARFKNSDQNNKLKTQIRLGSDNCISPAAFPLFKEMVDAFTRLGFSSMGFSEATISITVKGKEISAPMILLEQDAVTDVNVRANHFSEKMDTFLLSIGVSLFVFSSLRERFLETGDNTLNEMYYNNYKKLKRLVFSGILTEEEDSTLYRFILVYNLI